MKRKIKKSLIIGLGIGSLVAASAVTLTSCGLLSSLFPNKNNNNRESFEIVEKDSLLFAPKKASMARTVSVNVGMGDSEIIQVSGDEIYGNSDDFNILIDGGTGGAQGGKDATSPDGIKAVSSALNLLKIENVDLFVISHPHNDHMYGLPDVINNYGTKNSKVLIGYDGWKMLNDTKPTAIMQKVTKAITAKGIPTFDCKQITNYVNEGKPKKSWIPSNLVKFINNNGQEIGNFSVMGITAEMKDQNGKPVKSANAYSVTNKFKFNGYSELYAGDSEGETDKMLMEYYNAEHIKSDVYKVSHHGSATEGSNQKDWIKAVSPTYAIISTGGEDRYTLPDLTTLKNLLEHTNDASKIFGTQPFGKPLNVIKKIYKDKDKNILDNEKMEKIRRTWKPINDFINKHPTINNNNRGSSLIYDKNEFQKPTGTTIDFNTNNSYRNIDAFNDEVTKGFGIVINFNKEGLDFNLKVDTVAPNYWKIKDVDNPTIKGKPLAKIKSEKDDPYVPTMSNVVYKKEIDVNNPAYLIGEKNEKIKKTNLYNYRTK